MPNFRAESVDAESMDRLLNHQLDVTGAKGVEVSSRLKLDGTSVLWVNVNGVCLLRICQIKELIFTEE